MTAESEVTPEVIDYRIRAQIVWFLETASSPEDQRAYEKMLLDAKAPGIVPVEMIEQWADCVRTEGIDYKTVLIELYSEPVFSKAEQQAILKFHEVWNETADATPNPMPWTIEDLIGTPPWDRFVAEAEKALTVFMRRGHLLEKAKFDIE
jgi:hypothetical protein